MLWITVIMFAMATLVSTHMYNQSQNFGVTQSFSSCADIVTFQHIGINYTRIIKAFIIFRNEPGGPAAFFNQLSEFTQIFGSTIYIAQTLIGDSVVVRHADQLRAVHLADRLSHRCTGATSCGVG